MLLAKVKGIVLGLATAAIITTGVLAQAPSRVAASGNYQSLKDSVVVAHVPSATKQLTLPGSTALDPARLARIRARLAPARVVKLAQVWDRSLKTGQTEYRELRPGDNVKKGDLLAVLYSADVGSKKQDLLQALVQLELDQEILDKINQFIEAVPAVHRLTQQCAVQGDRTDVNRALNSLKAWDIPQEEIDELHAEAKKIHADKDSWFRAPEGRWVRGEKDEKAVKPPVGGKVDIDKETRDNSWGKVTLRAPFDGIIVEQNLHVGETVVDDTVNLFQIADVSRLLLIASCSEADLPSLDALRGKERPCTVRTVGAAVTSLTGTILEIGSTIDPNQHTAVIKGYVENPGQRIRAGQYVTVTIDIPPPDDVVEIPADALVDDGKQSLVFVQPDPMGHQFTMRRVQVTERFDRTVFVRRTPIPKEEQRTAHDAAEGLLPKEALRVGERVLLRGASGSVGNRLSTMERKLDQILEALGALHRPAPPKSDPHEQDASR